MTFGLILIGIVGVCILRYTSGARDAVADFVSPFLRYKNHVEMNVQNRDLVNLSKIQIIRQNEELRRQLTIQTARFEEQRRIELENDELRRVLALGSRTPYEYMVANVLVRDAAVGGHKIRIGRGSENGIRVGYPVLVEGGLYGRVIEVSDQSSLVLSVADPNCRVGVVIADTDFHGIMFGQELERWRSSPRCVIQYLPRDADYELEMNVVTSGLGTMIPRGIPVGVLVKDQFGNVTRTVDNLYKVAFLRPHHHSTSFDYVLIVMGPPRR